ncbi:MAG TPA: hypothetical protein VLJ86_22305 [Ramlibacter sp.]|nr:hypothetical protein [Ramlibacter sp.]
MFVWDWLWGDRRLLLASYGLKQCALGGVLLIGSLLLAQGLGMNLTEFHQTSKGLRRSEAALYHLPAFGIGMLVYGLLIWSHAWSTRRP